MATLLAYVGHDDDDDDDDFVGRPYLWQSPSHESAEGNTQNTHDDDDDDHDDDDDDDYGDDDDDDNDDDDDDDSIPAIYLSFPVCCW